ncbi:MFS transporter [Sinomicrobium weinanense]|uniref:MFS transporter n=1 Tax=Sinomicrobium weinanense TaxID=2842200 RepID=A0A926JWE5_9FLAO|nr:MFS transporter [Sinomicrobium weinanense]MBC9798601.1 MFS transporter [Sinomicrobium weinanense]MBU3122197.1 MFS transporter [Sinomicrobium weinanense]
MKDFYLFLKRNARQVSFGWVLTFLSSFGQTFLISLYVPEILKAFSLSEGTFGGIYAICTIVSSVIMLTIGHSIDHKPVKTVTTITVIGAAVSCFVLGISHYHIALLFLALIGLRLTGQGWMTHISMTVMSRYYDTDRGKALSVSALGYSIGEAFFPIVISTLILWYDYEVAAIASGVFLLLYLVRLYFVKLTHFDPKKKENKDISSKAIVRDYLKILSEKKFYTMIPASIVVAFTSTSFFFYQYVFVEDKGWSVSLYASFFTAYAITRFVMTLMSGLWVDRFTARRMFRIYLLPMTIGLLPLAFMDGITGALIFLILAGCSVGASGSVTTAVIAELYGVEKLGVVRSLYTMLVVLSTALGPFLVGLLLDADVDFRWIILGLFFMTTASLLNAQRIKNVP